MKSKVICLVLIFSTFLPFGAHADKVADFYKGKTVKIVIGGSMGGAYGLYAQLLSRHKIVTLRVVRL